MADTFRELRVYQLAVQISDRVWAFRERIQTHSPAIWFQIDKSAGSIEDNIAEGFGRETHADFANFLRYSRGSAMETESQVARAMRRQLIEPTEAEEVIQMCRTITVQLRNFQTRLRQPPPSPGPKTLREPGMPYGPQAGYSPDDEIPKWCFSAED